MISRPAKTRRRAKAPTATTKVAIYTRKSVDKGDSGEFGSIEAQREAVAAYVASQRGQGWVALPTEYDDLGESGATIQRPAFQRLLADIEAGQVDLVAVYRLDRLSRSQRDFIELMDWLDERGASFVSITERFDTSTPMGRFALGITMQVAQLERETTALRIRDKVWASRKRGLWTGGRPLLGYDIEDRRLVINEAEAEQVREAYRLYLSLGSLREAAAEMGRRGMTTKSWTNRSGDWVQGKPYTKNSLRTLLTAPAYAGLVQAEEDLVEGQHDAIVDRKTWEAAQSLLAQHRPEVRRPTRTKTHSLLQGLLRCGRCGEAMGPHSTSKGGRKYLSYVCRKMVTQGAASCPGSRAPAHRLEAAVIEKLQALGQDPGLQTATIRVAEAERRDRLQELRRIEKEAKADIKRLEAELAGPGARVPARRAQVEDALQRATEALDAARGETAALRAAKLSKADLRAAQATFTGVWDALFPAERKRIVDLAIEGITFDGAEGDLDIRYRPAGLRTLADDA